MKINVIHSHLLLLFRAKLVSLSRMRGLMISVHRFVVILGINVELIIAKIYNI